MANGNKACGGLWLATKFNADPFGGLTVRSYIGTNRRTTDIGAHITETYPPSMNPGDTAADHLQFHIRHEPINLELLARVFEASGPQFVQDWVNNQPTGQYARRAAFLYEFLTDEELVAPAGVRGSYIPALDGDRNFTSSPFEHERRVFKWKVVNNMPGTRFFCPAVPITKEMVQVRNYSVSDEYAKLVEEFGAELLSRSASWLTTSESMASFAIEKEADEKGRIGRFAQVIATWTGQDVPPSQRAGDTSKRGGAQRGILSEERLGYLQRGILGDKALIPALGYRKSPVFVGKTTARSQFIHYLAPPPEDVPAMIDGIETFLEWTRCQSSIWRAAIAAFGFVYVHPLIDGNGRVHRFLINDILRRDGAVPKDVILPVSVAITDDPLRRQGYDDVLDTISAPLMAEIRADISFSSKTEVYPDGVESDLIFADNDRARPTWRYGNYVPHILYMADIINTAIVDNMRNEAIYLRNHDNARLALKEICEMPDAMADRIIRSVNENQAETAGKHLRKQYPQVTEDMWAQFVKAVREAFADGE